MSFFKGICYAARSVHLMFDSQEPVDMFYNEVTVERTTPGSYFMVCGWCCGYFGIQELTSNQGKVVLFSVWDPTQGDDPNQVPYEDRASVENVGEGVEVHRFGGEGTGAKLMAPLPWKIGETVACFVTARQDGSLSSYTGWIKHPETGNWWRLEDFRRDGHSVGQNRQAVFSNGWVKTVNEQRWCRLSTARFTASNADWEAKDTIDAGTCTRGFYLSTGGDVCCTIDKAVGCQLDCSHVCYERPTLPPS